MQAKCSMPGSSFGKWQPSTGIVVFFRGICSRFSALAVGVNTYSWLLVKFLLGSLKFGRIRSLPVPNAPRMACGVRL